MPRDDSLLYSGSGKSPQEVQKERTKERLEKRSNLLPSAEIVIAEIEKEKLKTEKQILSFIGVGTDASQVKETLAALNLYDQSLTTLANKFKNILRLGKEPKEDEDDV